MAETPSELPTDLPCPRLPENNPTEQGEDWRCPDCAKRFVAAPVAAATQGDPYAVALVWVWEPYLAYMPDVTPPSDDLSFRLRASFYAAGDPKVTVLNFAQDPAIVIRPAEDQGPDEIALHLEAAGGLSKDMVAEMLVRCAEILRTDPDETVVTEPVSGQG